MGLYMAVDPPGYTTSRLTLPIVTGHLQGKNENLQDSLSAGGPEVTSSSLLRNNGRFEVPNPCFEMLCLGCSRNGAQGRGMGNALLTSEPRPERKLIAPLWHTLLFIAFLCGWAVFEFGRVARIEASHRTTRLPQYLFVVCFELAIVGYIWFFGLRRSGTTLADLIGGRWKRWTDVLRDAGVALLFWLVVAAFLIAAHFVIGPNDLRLKAIDLIAPRGAVEMITWFVVSVSAGVCEEIGFRGYLQKQFSAFTGRTWPAVALQAILFGAVHSYQGLRGAITLAGYGVLFGILAVRRKSLRPGMIQHTAQDFLSGIAASLIARRM